MASRLNLETIPYRLYETDLPQTGEVILGQASDTTIIVYQAFNDAIADYAIEHQKFGGPAYSFNRMTWLKPNFLWMMYRSGWATKPDQTRILALEMTKAGFMRLLNEGACLGLDHRSASKLERKERMEKNDVRVQWDPDHDPDGEKLERRAVQIGIKGEELKRFNEKYLLAVSDVTEFVTSQRLVKEAGGELFVMKEQVVHPTENQ